MTSIRKTQFPGNRDLTEFAGDVKSAFEGVVPWALVPLTDMYNVPFTIRLPRVPRAVLALDVRDDASPDSSVAGNARVNFTPVEGGVRINAIDGCSAGTKYRFLFGMVG